MLSNGVGFIQECIGLGLYRGSWGLDPTFFDSVWLYFSKLLAQLLKLSLASEPVDVEMILSFGLLIYKGSNGGGSVNLGEGGPSWLTYTE